MKKHNLRPRVCKMQQTRHLELDEKKMHLKKKRKRGVVYADAAAQRSQGDTMQLEEIHDTANNNTRKLIKSSEVQHAYPEENRSPYHFEITPTALERYHMLSLGRFYKEEDIVDLQKKCRKGMWTIGSLRRALNIIDTQDALNEYESREIVHIKGLVDKDELDKINQCFDGPVRKASFLPGTDAGKATSWCKYLYLKWRKDRDMPPEYQAGLTEQVEKKVHAEVKKSLNGYESNCFDAFFPRQKAREISIVHYPIKAKGIKHIGIDPHIDDTIFRTAMLHLRGEEKSDNIWIEEGKGMKLIELEPGDLVIFPRLSHMVKSIQRKSARRVCTFFF